MPNGLPNPWDFGQEVERNFNRVDDAPAIPPPPPVREYTLPPHLPTMEELWNASVLAPPPEVHYFPAEPPPAPEELIHKQEPIVATSSIEPEVEPETEPVEPEVEPEDVEDEVARAPWEEPIPAPVPEERSDESTQERLDVLSEVGALESTITIGCPQCDNPDASDVMDESTGLAIGVACPTCGPIYTCTECGVWEFEPHLEGCMHG